MKGSKKVMDFFPVTTTSAVYLDGTGKTLDEAIKNGELGGFSKGSTINHDIQSSITFESEYEGEGEVISYKGIKSCFPHFTVNELEIDNLKHLRYINEDVFDQLINDEYRIQVCNMDKFIISKFEEEIHKGKLLQGVKDYGELDATYEGTSELGQGFVEFEIYLHGGDPTIQFDRVKGDGTTVPNYEYVNSACYGDIGLVDWYSVGPDFRKNKPQEKDLIYYDKARRIVLCVKRSLFDWVGHDKVLDDEGKLKLTAKALELVKERDAFCLMKLSAPIIEPSTKTNFRIKKGLNVITTNYTNVSIEVPDSNKSVYEAVRNSTVIYEYRIENDRWGLKSGKLEKNNEGHYTPEQYDIAYNNMEGMKAVFKYAEEMGYSKIVFEKGDYPVMILNPEGVEYWANTGWEILLPSNIEIDFNGSIIRTIYDSTERSPYDKDVSSREPWRTTGSMFICSDSQNLILRNGTLMGCKYERSFIDAGEKTLDMGVGISIKKSSKNIIIDNMDISGFMADGIAAAPSAKGDIIIRGPWVYQGFYDNTVSDGTRKPEPSNVEIGRFSTDLFFIPEDHKELQLNADYNYFNFPNFAIDEFKYIWFDKNKKYISETNAVILQTVIVPNNAQYVAIQIVGESLTEWQTEYPENTPEENKETKTKRQKNFQVTQPISEHVTITNCNIHENHRGGIANCPNDTIIEKCIIDNNGNMLGDKPAFTDTTRYAINCEDNISRSVIIRDCTITNHFNNILMSSVNFVAENNYIANCTIGAFGIYDCTYGRIHNNYIANTDKIFGWAYANSARLRTIICTDNVAVNVDRPYDINRSVTSNCRIFANNNILRGVPGIVGGENIDYKIDYLSYNLRYAEISSEKYVPAVLNKDGSVLTPAKKEAILKNTKVYALDPKCFNSNIRFYINLEHPETENVEIDLGYKGQTVYVKNILNSKVYGGNWLYHYNKYPNMLVENSDISCNKFYSEAAYNTQYHGTMTFKNTNLTVKNFIPLYPETGWQYLFNFTGMMWTGNNREPGSTFVIRFEDCNVDLSKITLNNIENLKLIIHRFGDGDTVKIEFIRCHISLPYNNFAVVGDPKNTICDLLLDTCTYGNDNRFKNDYLETDWVTVTEVENPDIRDYSEGEVFEVEE